MEPLIIVGVIGFAIAFAGFILVFIWAVYKYYRLNNKLVEDIDSAKKADSNLLPLTFHLNNRGWGLSFLRIPFGLRAGGIQLTATVELTDDKIILTWIKKEELPYSKLNLVDVYNFGLSLYIIFHIKGRISTRYGNIANKALLKEVLEILKSKGVKLSVRADKIVSLNVT